ncbi:sciellin isoform X1 [Morone saxatilis]|uniref:sciellin isoform X1 n=1 Tax=Morone saxatilis TaxID=34816 RepID=UPI0015E24304|nr:sciellin isoform X1 [Morone saxatilis]
MSRFSASKNSLLQDNSWIKKTDDEDEDVDRDPNFGKIVLSQYRSTENLGGSEPEEVTTTKPIRTSTTSVQALTKRFSGSQDELRSSTLPSSKTTSSYTKSTYSNVKSDSPKTTTTTTVTKDGTTITSTQSLRSPGITSPTTTFTERVKSSSKGAQYSTYSPTKTTKVTETTVTSSKDPEDKLDSLIPPSIKDDFSPTDSKRTVSSTETVTVKSSPNGDGIKTTTTTRTSSTAEDDLYDTLLPKSITSSPVSTSIKKREIVTVESSKGGESPTPSSPSSTRRTTSYSSYTDDIPSTRTTSYTISTKPSEDYSSDRKTYSYSRPDSSYEYSSITSPSAYTSSSYRSSSRSDDILADPIYSKSSTKSVYASPERAVLEKDLCTYCHKPFNADAKMVLDDMKINCHASCFKCAVCNSTLGHMKAGDSMWIYKRMVHCENCFEVTREKWRR